MVVVVLATHVQAAIIDKPPVVISMGLLMRGTADSGFVLCNHRTVVKTIHQQPYWWQAEIPSHG
jgi:hypothetical protein